MNKTDEEKIALVNSLVQGCWAHAKVMYGNSGRGTKTLEALEHKAAAKVLKELLGRKPTEDEVKAAMEV
jgi:hypothetical protein